eukprot:scaffold11661_cov54-Cylindrotheca_fusiformis.AAC.1
MVDRGVLDSNGVLPFPIQTTANERLLPPHFKPGKWDVICHNGKSNRFHSKFSAGLFVPNYQITYLTPLEVGNMRFKLCIGNYLRSYTKASTRSGKSAVITDIVTSIRDSSDTGGGFVRFDSSNYQWYEVGDKVARDKVGQALRDTLRNRKSMKEQTERVFPPLVSFPRKKQEDSGSSEMGESSNLPFNLSYTPFPQVQNGCETGALSPTVTVADHNYSSTPPMRRYSTVTLDSCLDCLRWTWNDSESQSTSTGTCTHVTPYMGYFVENVADWFEHEMTAR